MVRYPTPWSDVGDLPDGQTLPYSLGNVTPEWLSHAGDGLATLEHEQQHRIHELIERQQLQHLESKASRSVTIRSSGDVTDAIDYLRKNGYADDQRDPPTTLWVLSPSDWHHLLDLADECYQGHSTEPRAWGFPALLTPAADDGHGYLIDTEAIAQNPLWRKGSPDTSDWDGPKAALSVPRPWLVRDRGGVCHVSIEV